MESMQAEDLGSVENGVDSIKILKKTLRKVAKKHGIGLGKMYKSLRIVLTGVDAGAGILETIDLLGKNTITRRLTAWIHFRQSS